MADPQCKNCNDSGWIPTGEGNRVRQCACVRERSIRVALDRMYWNAELTHFKPGTAAQVQRWLNVPTVGLLISGNVGSGKTHLAAAILRAWYHIGKKAKFLRAADLYLRVRQSYSEGQENEWMIFEETCKVPLLILDDLGAGSTSDHERRVALEILDRRMNHVLPTVVTTNWTLLKIAELMDERIASRLAMYESIAFAGADRRKRVTNAA